MNNNEQVNEQVHEQVHEPVFEPVLEQAHAHEQKGGADFWSVLKWLFIAMLIAVVSAFIVFGFLLFFGRDIFESLCSSSFFYNTLTTIPVIIELVGYALLLVGVGIPIVGVGMFLEVFTIICDFLRKDPGWQIDVALGIFGLIPFAGLFGNAGKLIRKLL